MNKGISSRFVSGGEEKDRYFIAIPSLKCGNMDIEVIELNNGSKMIKASFLCNGYSFRTI